MQYLKIQRQSIQSQTVEPVLVSAGLVQQFFCICDLHCTTVLLRKHSRLACTCLECASEIFVPFVQKKTNFSVFSLAGQRPVLTYSCGSHYEKDQSYKELSLHSTTSIMLSYSKISQLIFNEE